MRFNTYRNLPVNPRYQGYRYIYALRRAFAAGRRLSAYRRLRTEINRRVAVKRRGRRVPVSSIRYRETHGRFPRRYRR